MSNSSYGGIPSDKLYLVRVQAGLEGTTLKNGDLSITRATDGNIEINPTRNTLHFALNGVVSNHAYGSFNHEYVFVSPLEKTLQKNPGMLAGFNPADTFIHQDENNQVHLHEPILVAPTHSHVPQDLIDGGIQVVRYDVPENTSVEDAMSLRDQAVSQVLESLDAPVKKIGMWGWTDQTLDQFNAEKSFISTLGYDPENVATRHDGSVEDKIELAYGSLLYHQEKVLEGKERLYDLPSGMQIPHTEMVTEAKKSLQDLINGLSNPVFQSKMSEFIENMSNKYEEDLAAKQTTEPVLGTVNSFDLAEGEEFVGFNSSSEDSYAPFPSASSVPPPPPSVDMNFNGAMPPPPNFDPFENVAVSEPNVPGYMDNEPPMEAYMDDMGRDYSSDDEFDALLNEVPQVSKQPQPQPQEPQGVSNMATPQDDSVFEGNTVDLNTFTPQYLLHPKRTMDELHQAMGLISNVPSDQVQAHFGKWSKQQVNDLNTLLTNDARQLFNDTLEERNAGKPLPEQQFKTLSGAWYNTAKGSDSALKGLDANAFQRVPVVEFATIDPKTRGLQEVTRFALQANDPTHPHVAQFLNARADMVSNKADQVGKTNAQKLDDLNAQMASAETNGIYTGLEKEGLPLKSALNIVQHPNITGRAEEVKLGEANALEVADNGLSLVETPKEVFGIRSIDPENPVPFAELEAAENDRKRDFAVGMEEGLEISQPEVTDKDDAEAKKDDAKAKKDDAEAKKDDAGKFTPKKPGNGRNNFNKNPENNNGMNFAGGNDGGKKKGNKTEDLVDDLDEKPKRKPMNPNEVQVPSRRYMLEQLLDGIRKVLAALIKLLANILRFTFNAGKTAYYSGKLGFQKMKGRDTFDTKAKLDNALLKTASSLSFDRTNASKAKRDGKFVAAVGMPNGLGDKTIDEATQNKLDELNSKFGKKDSKYDTLSNAIAKGDVVVESPVNAKELEDFSAKVATDTMFTTKDGQRFIVVGESTPVDGQPPRLDVIELNETTIIPIDRDSNEFTRKVTSVSLDEVKEQLEGVSYESKVLAPEIVASDKRFNNAPDKFFAKYPDEKTLNVDTSVDVLNDRIGRIMQDKKNGNSYAIVGVDTIVNKDGTNDFKYQVVKMDDNTPADLNYLRDVKIETVSPSFFNNKAPTISDGLDPKLKDRLVDLQANGIQIQKNGMGLDIADLKKLGETFLEMSKRGLHRLTSQEERKLTSQIDNLSKNHEAVSVKAPLDNQIKFDPSVVAEKLKAKGQQHINDVFASKNIDPLDPAVQASINEKMGGFFGKQNRVEDSLAADQKAEPVATKPLNKAVFALDYSGLDYEKPDITNNPVKFGVPSSVKPDSYAPDLYIDYEPTAVPLPAQEAAFKPIDQDHDVNVENTAFTASQDSTFDFKPTLVQGPLPETKNIDDVYINKNINDFVHSVDNSINFPGVHTGYTADELPEFEPKDALNEKFANDIWQDAPRGSLGDKVSIQDVGFDLSTEQIELVVEKPVITNDSFDQLLKEFNEKNPVTVAPIAVAQSLADKNEPEIDWSNDALKLDLTSESSPLFKADAKPQVDFEPVQDVQVEAAANEVADISEAKLDLAQQTELDNAIEEIQARIEQDKSKMLQELAQDFDTPESTAYADDTVQYIVEQQAEIQKQMAKGPNSVFTGESVPSKLSFSMSELSSMPTKDHGDLVASIYQDDFAEQMQRKALATFANRNPNAKSLDANEVKAVTEHVRLSDAAHLMRLHRDEQNSQNYEQSALFAPGLRSINGVEGDQNLMSRRNRHEPFDALKQRVIHELEASGNHPATVKLCEDLIQKRISSEVSKLGRACEAAGLQLNRGFTQTVSHEQSVRFQDAIKSQFPDTDIKINDLVKNTNTGETLTVVGRRLEDVQLEGGAVSQEERMLVARSFAIGLVGATESISPSQIQLQEQAGGRLSNRQIENFEYLNRVDLNGLNIGANPTKVDLSNNSELATAKDNILAMLNNPKDHPDDSLACELQGMRDSLNATRDRFFAIQRDVLSNPAVAAYMDKVTDELRKANINPSLVSNVVPSQNEQGALVRYDRVINMDSLNAIREMNSTNKADANGFYQQTDFAKVLIEANDPQLNAQIAELGRLSKDIANTMGSIDEIRNDMVDRVFNGEDQQLGHFTNEDITRLHQQVTNDTLSTRESLPTILGSMAQYSEVANNIENNRHAPEPVSNDELVNDGKSKFGNFIGKIGSMFKRNDADAESQISNKSDELKRSNEKTVEVKVEVQKDKRHDSDNSLSM